MRDVTRRGFLKLLGTAVPAGVALSLLPVDGFDALVYQHKLPVINDGPIAVVDFRTMVARVQAAMAKAMPYPVQSVMSEPDRFLGHVTTIYGRHVTWEHQLSLASTDGSSVRKIHEGAVLLAADLDVIGAQLAAAADQRGVNAFAALTLPNGVDEAVNVATANGPTVRGIIMYDVISDQMVYRFDALGGRA